MSNDNNPDPTVPVVTAPVSKSVALMAEVSASVKESAPQVRQRLVAALVEKEVISRVSLLETCLNKRVEAEKELKKASKPDTETFDADGKVVAATFSKSAADALKKARETLDKLDKAMEKALGENDFSKLKELGK
jgi:hypothetical protein